MFERHYSAWPKGVPKHVTIPETALYENLAVSARRYPRKPAILYYDTPISYGELHESAEALAGHLQHQGVKKGDRVLLYMQNSPQFVIAYYGILRADAVVVPVNPMNRVAELEYLAEDTRARVVICGQELFDNVAPLIERGELDHVIVAAYADYVRTPTDLELPAEVAAARRSLSGTGVSAWHEVLATEHRPTAHTATPEDIAVIPYSSGTTGHPKGCVHTHRSVMATTVFNAAWIPAPADSFTLGTLPLFHVTGMQGTMNTVIFNGAAVVQMTRWNRRVAAELIQRHKVTSWTAITTMVVDLLADPEIHRYDLSSLVRIAGGGAAMPKAVAEKLQRLVGLPYLEGYGLTETMAPTHMNPPDAPKAQCLGIPIMNTDARVIDLDRGTELGPNEVGEIIVHGPQVFQGYWNRPKETAAAFIELEGKRFFRTGDIGYYDEQGYFFIVDRLKRMINAAGFKVWPTEVESMMYAHPAIQEVCVISAPHPRRGETVKALVVLRAGARASEEEIIAWCHERMAAYKVPEKIEFVETLPKSPTGKLQWRLLQEREWHKASS